MRHVGATCRGPGPPFAEEERPPSGRKLRAALRPPPGQDPPTGTCAHPQAESVRLLPLPVVRLVGPLHDHGSRREPRRARANGPPWASGEYSGPDRWKKVAKGREEPLPAT